MKEHQRRPKWRVVVYVIVASIFLILLLANTILNTILPGKFRQTLRQFSSNTQVSFSSVHANLYSSSLSVTGLTIHYKPYGTQPQHQHEVYFSNISLTGVSFLKILFNKKLVARMLDVDGGDIKLDSFLIAKKDSAQTITVPKIPVSNVYIDHFQLKTTNIWLNNNNQEHLLVKAGISLDDIKIADINKPLAANNLQFGGIEALLSDIRYTLPGANYTIQVKTVEINSIKEMLEIDSLTVIPQYTKNNPPKTGNQPPVNIQATIAKITVLKLDVMKLSGKKFIAGKVILTNPVTSMYAGGGNMQQPIAADYLKENDFEINIDSFKIDNPFVKAEVLVNNGKTKTGKNFSTSMPFKNVSIDHFAITNANISGKYNSANTLHVKGDINIDNISADSVGKHFGAIACNLSNIECNIPGVHDNLSVQKLVINTNRSSLRAEGIKIIPQYGKLELGRMLGHQTDYLEATIANVQMVNFNVMKLTDRKLLADKIVINGCVAYVFRDRRLIRPLEPQPLPIAFLKTLPFDIRVHTFQITHSSVAYEEFPKDGVQTGTLKVEKFQISVSPLVNHPLSSDPARITMNVDGAIMGSGSINAVIYLPFNVQEDYTVKGTINNLDLTSLNSSAENLGKFHIESGLLNNLEFQFNFNDQKSTGSIVGVYHDLVLDKLKGNDKKIARIPTFVVKHVIIPKNKDASLPVARRTGKIDYPRDPTRYLSFYLLKSLLTGIRSSFTFGFLLPE